MINFVAEILFLKTIFGIFGGFTVFYCDTTLDVHYCMDAAPFFLFAYALKGTPRVPRPGIEPSTYQMAGRLTNH